jgi:Dolichyl-phosphate-mannose-protein mannosyltransferase
LTGQRWKPKEKSIRSQSTLLLLTLAGLYLLLQVSINGILGGYGLFRDEFYYLANAGRLAWGYVDHPPLAPLLLAGVQAELGDATIWLRLLPALAGAGSVLLAGLTARRLGGGSLAQITAAMALFGVPVYNVLFGFYSMNAFEIFLWAAAAYVAVAILGDDLPRLWLLFGLLAGIGLQNKHTFALFAAGLILGLLLHQRSAFRTPWLWVGGLLAFSIILPNLVWQEQNGWPTLEFYAGAAAKNISRNPIEVLFDQLLSMNPILAAVWLPGLIWLLRTRLYRPLAWTYLLPLLVLLVTGSNRPDRLAPAYVPLFAAGAVAIEQTAQRRSWRWLQSEMGFLVLASIVVAAPLGLPILTPETTARYAHFFGLSSYEAGVTAELPQYFADRFGWQELAETVTRIYDRLPPNERKEAAIFTSNYGEASAIQFYGQEDGLPEPISGHNTYWLWGPGTATGEVLITVNIPRDGLAELYENVEWAGYTSCRFCVSYENNAPIFVARGLKVPLADVWPQVKHYE